MRKYWSGTVIPSVLPHEIFVFGSNPQGWHAGGGARAALAFGAIMGVGRGLVGQTYALVTKSLEAGFTEPNGTHYPIDGERSVPLVQITQNVAELYEAARQNPGKDFLITFQYETFPDGTPKASLSGYTSEETLQTFLDHEDIPRNIVFHDSYKSRM